MTVFFTLIALVVLCLIRDYLYNGRGRWIGVSPPKNCTCIHGVDWRAIYPCVACEELKKL